MFLRPVRDLIRAISSRFSDACVWTTSWCSMASRATASSSSREHDTANRGAKAARRRPSARPCQRLAIATLSSIECEGLFQQPRRHRGVGVHHALADDGAKAHRLERLEDRIGVVNRFHRQHGRRARSKQLGCGLLCRGGKRPRRVRGLHRPHPRLQPLEQGEIVGIAAKERLTEMDVRLDESRQQIRIRCPSITRSAFASFDGPIDAIRPPRTTTSPSTTSKASFMVRIVAFRTISEGL